MGGAVSPLPQYAFMAWCSGGAQGQLYLYFYSSRTSKFGGRGLVYRFSNGIAVLTVDTNLQSLHQNTCELHIFSEFDLQCIFQVSVSPHQRDVYVVFVIELSICLC
jgi:hypothetical protein